jgi:hypothetical protein
MIFARKRVLCARRYQLATKKHHPLDEKESPGGNIIDKRL